VSLLGWRSTQLANKISLNAITNKYPTIKIRTPNGNKSDKAEGVGNNTVWARPVYQFTDDRAVDLSAWEHCNSCDMRE
jgi:hypothetical protein